MFHTSGCKSSSGGESANSRLMTTTHIQYESAAAMTVTTKANPPKAYILMMSMASGDNGVLSTTIGAWLLRTLAVGVEGSARGSSSLIPRTFGKWKLGMPDM